MQQIFRYKIRKIWATFKIFDDAQVTCYFSFSLLSLRSKRHNHDNACWPIRKEMKTMRAFKHLIHKTFDWHLGFLFATKIHASHEFNRITLAREQIKYY